MARAKNIKSAPQSHQAILCKMFTGNKLDYDLFDFPGVSPHILDELKEQYCAINGSHRQGFVLSLTGAKFAARLQPKA